MMLFAATNLLKNDASRAVTMRIKPSDMCSFLVATSVEGGAVAPKIT